MTIDPTTIKTAVSYGLLDIRSIAGKGVCVTGSHSVTRAQLHEFIRLLGGVPHDAIKADTQYLLIPNGNEFRKGSKYQAALKRAVNVLHEEEFVRLVTPSVEELLRSTHGPGTA